ncbi:MAG: response regulator [Bacteroidia bacterium]
MKPSPKLHIFTVEDNAMYTLALDLTLKDRFNYQITDFDSAEKCLENIYLNPDIIILDYMLKGMNGQEALIKIKQALPNCYVIIMSVQKDIDVAVDLIQLGAYTYIKKSNSALDKLVETIDKIRDEMDNK